ncbi:MAG: sigma-54 dependent transcriptional regulator [Pseudobdellovibrionaceae bacterium]|nr:sigma-54 dependent transcriptional regulator [Pseudobdellovibrionaceae bacterium]
MSLQNALDAASLRAKNQAATTDKNVRTEIIGESPAIQKVKQLIQQYGSRDAKVLITGETGTGKELVAHGIWRSSIRANRPFIIVNAAAVPESLVESELFGHKKGAFTGATANQIGKLEMADTGTVFLDEIGELSLLAQSKLLRFLETGEIQVLGSNTTKKCDVRLIAATSRNLALEIKAGRFREDLFFRLDVARIEIPALKDRQDDIEAIFTHFVGTVCRRYGEPMRMIDKKVVGVLLSHNWPGNVRELRNVAERAVLLSKDFISVDLIREMLGQKMPETSQNPQPQSLSEAVSLKEFRRTSETHYIRQILRLADNSVARAAHVLDIDRSYLYQKLKELE